MVSEKTKNISFKNFQYKLQDNNINNCFFMNETIDRNLVDVDVYEKIDSLRNNDIARIAFIDSVKKECTKNIWYYFREVVRLPDACHLKLMDDNNLARYPLTAKMAKMIYLYTKGISSVCVINPSVDIEMDLLSYITLIYLSLWEEFFNVSNNDNKHKAILSTTYTDNAEYLSGFYEDLFNAGWSMNQILCDMKFIVPDNRSFYPKIGEIKVTNKKELMDFSYISPFIDNDDSLSNFLFEADYRCNRKCIGRVIQNKDFQTLHMFETYVARHMFTKEDLMVFDIPIDNDDMNIYII